MLVLNAELIERAKKNHSDWAASLRAWETTVRGASWRRFLDVRATYSSVDLVKGFYIFNIAHNKARLISTIGFEEQAVTIIEILTHAEYGRRG
jgi:mRNA interferase HigB